MNRMLVATFAAAAALAPGLGNLAGAQAPGPPVASPQTVYVVVEGDTLGGIAAAHGTTVAAIAIANGIADPDLVVVGAVLVVPPPAGVTVHVVAEGETLSGIAALYGVDADAIAAANDLTLDTLIFPGDGLVIP